ncbi:MAG: hypothetical protein HN458_01470 [Euryarchaeota archaeon]|nr:hypothetical protein [Euryarchaeota archaeon]
MFTGVIESKSHEGGFLVSFTGSSPALESIIINAESGIYIGKVDAVLGNTNAPLAHVAHIDRKLDLDALIGVEVGIRAKKQRDERSRGPERDGRRDDRRGGRDDRGYQNRDQQGGRFERNDRGRGDNRGGGDWECPKCQNSNFAFRTECNRCGEPKGHGGGRGRSDDRRGGRDDRRGGRDDRGNRGGRGGEIYTDNDWECPKCQNSNFAFRTECNRCGEPRGGGGGRGRSDDRRGGRNDRSRGGDRGYQSRDRQGGRFERGGAGGNEDRRDGDWDCSKCQNSNFAFRTECNRCGAPRGGGGGGNRGPRRDSRDRPPQRDSGDRPPRREFSERPPRREGDRPPRRDGRDRRDERGSQNRGSYNQSRPRSDDRPSERKSREPRTFRKSRGNGPGHAHNRPPKPLTRDRED